MKLVLILLVLCVTFMKVTSERYNTETYAQLSLRYTYNAFMNINLGVVNNDTNPGTISALRKQLLLTRTYLDIFCYAYELTECHGGDCFLVLRKTLNKGYTLIGDFDDLQHVNYTESDRIKLLGRCLEWKQEFRDDIDNNNFKKYLTNVSTHMVMRPKSDLSIDFWGNVTAVPDGNLSGYQNIGLLSTGQLKDCINAYTFTVNLEDIWNKQYHNLFHDYRKLIRSINFVGNYFPAVYSQNIKTEIHQLEKAYTLLGKINDLINEYVYYTKRGNLRAAEEKKNEIVEKWKSLRAWFSDIGLMGILRKLVNLIN